MKRRTTIEEEELYDGEDSDDEDENFQSDDELEEAENTAQMRREAIAESRIVCVPMKPQPKKRKPRRRKGELR